MWFELKIYRFLEQFSSFQVLGKSIRFTFNYSNLAKTTMWFNVMFRFSAFSCLNYVLSEKATVNLSTWHHSVWIKFQTVFDLHDRLVCLFEKIVDMVVISNKRYPCKCSCTCLSKISPSVQFSVYYFVISNYIVSYQIVKHWLKSNYFIQNCVELKHYLWFILRYVGLSCTVLTYYACPFD